MKNTFWLGGSPCSGKSTLAQSLTEQYELYYYECDKHYDDHIARANPAEHPVMCRLRAMGWNELWMRPVEEQVRDELAFYREEFGMILEDLAALERGGKPVLLEGAALLPELLHGIGVTAAQALYAVPTEDFQRAQYARRPWIRGILAECIDPEQAFENWMARDADFAREVASSAQGLGYRVLLTDEDSSPEGTLHTAVAHFSLRLIG